MAKTPRWHERILVFNKRYNTLCDMYKDCDVDAISSYPEIRPYFNILKSCFEFYHKSLKDILNDKGACLYLPSEVLIKSKDCGLIDDAQVWLDYIEDLNVFYQTYGNSTLLELANKIINRYKPKLSNVYKMLNTFFESQNFDEDYSNKHFPTEINQEISATQLGIMEHSFNLLMEYFKSNHNIKYVWLHGSRAKGNAKKNSDIDLIFDVSPEELIECKTDFYNLAIPYRIDCVSKNESNIEEFLNKCVDDAILIYKV